MSTAETFKEFVENLAIQNRDQISDRYGEITQALNKRYRETESKEANSLLVGSYGRGTAVNGASDVDMIYMLPQSEYERFKNRQSDLLQDVRAAIKKRYSTTDIGADGQVVVVSFGNQDFEVVPAFEQEDKSFKHPDTNNGGSWRYTDPRPEIKAISSLDADKKGKLRHLCKMTRAWRNKSGLVMGGLLIDTLAYNFLNGNDNYDGNGFSVYDAMSRDFFEYLSGLPEQEYYLAPGSCQRVYVKAKFQKKAKKAYDLCVEAIAAEGVAGVNKKWKKVFGRPFPADKAETKEARSIAATWEDTEQFIDDRYPIDIKYSMRLECDVTQPGFRMHRLSEMIRDGLPLRADKKLLFRVSSIDVPGQYHLEWKVLNRGELAQKKNMIRGQIVRDGGHRQREERSSFMGPHFVECYAVKNGVVVARDRIDVPIKSGQD